MLNWEERYQLALVDYDIKVTSFRRDSRVNILVKPSAVKSRSSKAPIRGNFGGVRFAQCIRYAFVRISAKDIDPQKSKQPLFANSTRSHCWSWDRKDFQLIEGVFVETERPPVLYVDEQSVIYSHHSSQQHAIMAMEFFAGGFGGWKMAEQFLKEHHQVPIIRTFALDYDARDHAKTG